MADRPQCSVPGCSHPESLDGLCRDHVQLNAAGFDPNAVQSYRKPKVVVQHESKLDPSTPGMTQSFGGSGLTRYGGGMTQSIFISFPRTAEMLEEIGRKKKRNL